MSRKRKYSNWKRYASSDPVRLNLVQTALSYYGVTPIIRFTYDSNSYNTPNYWTLRRLGLLPNHPYTSWSEKLVTPVAPYRNTYWTGVFDPNPPYSLMYYRDDVDPVAYNVTVPQQFGYPPNWDLGLNPDPATVETLRSRLLSKVSDQRASLGEFVGEYKQCTNMFLSTSRRILRAAVALRRFDIVEAASVLGFTLSPQQLTHLSFVKGRFQSQRLSPTLFLSNVWLEYIYGWKPLLQDLYGTVFALTDGIEQQRVNHVVSIFERSRIKTSEDFAPSGAYHKKVLTLNNQVTHSIHCRYKVINSSTVMSQQLGLINPASIAWNLLPFSFVVDWFLDVNSFLDQLSATSGLEFVDGTETFTCKGTRQYTINGFRSPLGGAASFQFNNFSRSEFKKKIRVVLSSFPSVPLRFGSGLSNDNRKLSALALLRQAFSKH